MSGVFRDSAHEDYVLDLLCDKEPPQASEQLRLDRAELRKLVKSFWVPSEETKSFLELVSALLQGPAPSKAAHNKESVLDPERSRELKLQILHSIIDSAIDADKLDYLLRDAHHCNVSYSHGIDIERFYQSMTPLPYLPTKPNSDATPVACVGVSEKGVAPLESILVARYQMFSTVYWHHTARAATAMLQFVVREYIASKPTGWELRLAKLLDEFRSLSDRQALRWLAEEVGSPTLVDDVALRRSLVSVCYALLGERELLYWPIFELRYGRGESPAFKLVQQLVGVSDHLAKPEDDPLKFITKTRMLHRSLSGHLQAKIGNDIVLRDGDILMDVPPAGKDQIDNIYVMVSPDVIQPIEDISPLADSVRDAFRFWVRKVRVFISPEAWSRCSKAGITQEKLQKTMWKVLREVCDGEDPQQALFRDM